MLNQKNQNVLYAALFAFGLLIVCIVSSADAQGTSRTVPGNFGLPGVIDMPTAGRLPDGELVLTHQNHKYLFMSSVSFQALPNIGLSFRYGGQGREGHFAQGRHNWDRSFDAHISIVDEGKYLPAISLGLRDFIGTGWYSSEYIVGSKSFGQFELSAGLGFGRLAGRGSFSNPLGVFFFTKFDQRDRKKGSKGGTLGNINWFQGDAAAFYGMTYRVGDKILISSEYTSDLMLAESRYLEVKSPWNFGASYRFNDYFSLSGHYLYGSEASITAHVTVNPGRPPSLGGKELAPVPMRLRSEKTFPTKKSNEEVIRKVLRADRFEVHKIDIQNDTISVLITNTNFRSTAQAVGRVASTLQRFSSDDIKFATISFYSKGLQTSKFRIDLEKITTEQFGSAILTNNQPSIVMLDTVDKFPQDKTQQLEWGVGPYVEHRLFNPDLPLSLETGIEIEGQYKLTPNLKISTAVRKSILTNLTDNKRRSNSVLPRVNSDWPLYDFAGQSGHIHELTLSYVRNLAPGLYGRAHGGLLEPFFAGIGGEILFKPAHWPLGIGIDIHRVRKRDYDMRFDLLDYTSTVGHLSLYYDAGGMFDVELNAGRYLAWRLGYNDNYIAEIWQWVGSWWLRNTNGCAI